ncbi:MAG: complex subunit conserved region [Rickettsiales bacterium]|nr:complex subunit conserved region [Rickettsiales bacterium]
MPDVVIYQPAKTAMQSGKANTRYWKMDFDQKEGARRVESLMGWTASSDMQQELMLRFVSKEDAVEYAKRQGLNYEVREPQEADLSLKAYADNFTRPLSLYKDWE